MSVSNILLHSGQHKCAISQDTPSLYARILSTNSCVSQDGWWCCERGVWTWTGDEKPEDLGTRGK